MARFHVYTSAESTSLLLDVQANLLSHLNTRVVVPLLRPGQAPEPAQILNPVFEIDDNPWLMATQFLAAVPHSLPRKEIADLTEHLDIIVAALDCLFQGV